MKLPAGAVTGAILGVLFVGAALFALPADKTADQMKPVAVKPIAMVPAPAPAPEPAPIVAPAPEAPAVVEPPPPSTEPPPAKPNLHPRPHDKALPAKMPPPDLPAQPPPVQAKPTASAAKPSAFQCFKLRQLAAGMSPAEQQDYAAKYLTAPQREQAKACLGTK